MSISQYTPEKLVAISRYQNYFPTLPADVQQDTYERIAELIEEEKDCCDKGNFKHMAQILTSIALYETLQKAREQRGGGVPDRLGGDVGFPRSLRDAEDGEEILLPSADEEARAIWI